MHRRAWQLLLAVTVLFAQGPEAVFAARGDGSAASPPPIRLAGAEFELGPLEGELFESAAAGDVDRHWLFTAALVAGGTSDSDRIEAYRTRVEQSIDRLRQTGAAGQEPRDRAQAVFELLHRRICYGDYQVECTDPAETLDTGRYNCVSSAVLFNCLAEGVGLTALAVEKPGHAYSVLELADERLDVETTCSRWFEIVDDPQARREILSRATAHLNGPIDGRSARFGPPPAEYVADRELSRPALVALIYYNRGVDFLEERRFEEAVAANAKAWRLDPDSRTIFGNLLAALNNWALDLADRAEFQRAVDLLRQCRGFAPEHRPFRVNQVAVYQRWIERLVDQNHYRQALAIAGQAEQDLPANEHLDATRWDIYRGWSLHLADRGQLDEALDLLADARRRYPGRAEVSEAEAAAVNHRGLHLLAESRFEAAVAVFDRGLTLQPAHKVLRHNRRAAILERARTR
ncbi:MAG: hypothetical protein WD278_16930 [Pirellulales bacterium]